MSSSTAMSAAHHLPDPRKPIDEQTVVALQEAVGVLAAKWSVIVLARLSSGTHRFNELLRQIDGVSRRMLSATLRQLERDGLVERHVYARVPARVEYELSPAGEHLLSALIPLAGWSMEHADELAAARVHFDRLQLWRAESQELQARSQASTPRIV
jgi:DNA-binding HxlR family transcriptional regulator